MIENDTRREMKATIEDVKPIFRPIFPRTENDDLLCVNWASAVAALSTVLFAVAGYRGAGDWAYLAAIVFAFTSGVLYGVYFEDDEQAADEQAADEQDDEIDEIEDDAYRANSDYDERTDLIRRLTY